MIICFYRFVTETIQLKKFSINILWSEWLKRYVIALTIMRFKNLLKHSKVSKKKLEKISIASDRTKLCVEFCRKIKIYILTKTVSEF